MLIFIYLFEQLGVLTSCVRHAEEDTTCSQKVQGDQYASENVQKGTLKTESDVSVFTGNRDTNGNCPEDGLCAVIDDPCI